MPFTLHFVSMNNTEILDIDIIEQPYNINDNSNKSKSKITSRIDKIVFDSNFNQPIKHIPEFIKHIKFGHYFLQDISNIGDHIESLEFEVAIFNYNPAIFPKNLKTLIIRADNITSNIENLPSGLEKLIIQCPTFNDNIVLDNTSLKYLIITSYAFDKELPNMPLTLKELKLNCDIFNKTLNNLSSGLEKLVIYSKMFNQLLDNLPSGLKILILKEMRSFLMPLDNLPTSIEILELHFGYECPNKYKHDINHLSNCNKISVANYWGDLNLLSDSIKELDVWFPPTKSRDVREYIQHWKRFPSNLSTLDINRELSRANRIHDMTDIIKSNINCSGICINGIVF